MQQSYRETWSFVRQASNSIADGHVGRAGNDKFAGIDVFQLQPWYGFHVEGDLRNTTDREDLRSASSQYVAVMPYLARPIEGSW